MKFLVLSPIRVKGRRVEPGPSSFVDLPKEEGSAYVLRGILAEAPNARETGTKAAQTAAKASEAPEGATDTHETLSAAPEPSQVQEEAAALPPVE